MSGFVEQLEQECAARFVRWDKALWHAVVTDDAARLARTLTADADEETATLLLQSYLKLCAEGIGLGYLLPEGSGAQNFFTYAFRDLVPRTLVAAPEKDRAELLASCFNLGENLEKGPVWLRRIFIRRAQKLSGVAGLEGLVAEVSKRALGNPEKKLRDFSAPAFIELSGEDPRFLPGGIHFLAPAVVCVHDRDRTAVAGRQAVTMGVWLDDSAPLVLGGMGCGESPACPSPAFPMKGNLSRHVPDPAEWIASARNEFRAVFTLHTSQFLYTFLPA